MRHLLTLAGAAALAALSVAPTAASAQEPAAATDSFVKLGRLVVSSDGKRLGRIDRISGARIGLIVDSKYVYLPVATLTAGENSRVVTSLSFKDVTKG